MAKTRAIKTRARPQTAPVWGVKADAAKEAIGSWFDAANMGLEAGAVISYRLLQASQVNPFTNPLGASLAALEMNRMVTEKALTGLQVMARAGQADPLAPMRAQVSANRRRLAG